MTEYFIPIEPTDTSCAFDCEAKRAREGGMKGLADRQAAVALHIRNASAKMQDLCPEGFRTRARIVIDFVPDVNPVLRDEVRNARRQ